MDVAAAKTRFFKRNSEKADKLTLHAHKEDEFWLWVRTWALFIQKPYDLGFSEEGYSLPPLEVRWHEIASEIGSASGRERVWHDVEIWVVAVSLKQKVNKHKTELILK